VCFSLYFGKVVEEKNLDRGTELKCLDLLWKIRKRKKFGRGNGTQMP
jgi:hypothetical protein